MAFRTAQNVTTPPAASLEQHVGASSMDVSQIASAFAGTREAVQLAMGFDSQLFLNVACVFRANGPFFGVYIPAVDQAKHLESVQSKLRGEGYTVQTNADGSFRAWSKNPQDMPNDIQQHIDELDQSDKLKGGNLFGINIDAIRRTARDQARKISQDPKQQEQDFYDIALLNLASTMVHEAVHADTVASQALGDMSMNEALKQRYGASQSEGPSEAAQRAFTTQMLPEINRRRATKNLPPLEMSSQIVHASNWYQLAKEAGKGGHSKSCVLALLPDLENLSKMIREEDLYTEEGKEYGRESESHVTVLYGLDPEEVGSKECRQKLEPWFGSVSQVELLDVSVFENEDKPYDVVKIDVRVTDGLKAMNASLRELPYESDFPDYHPHVTLAYVLKGKGKNYIGLKMPKSAEISKIVLSDPEGKRSTLWKSAKEASNWYDLAKTAQYGAQFTHPRIGSPSNDQHRPWDNRSELTEMLLEPTRVDNPDLKEGLEKRMNHERRTNKVERQEKVDTKQVAETLLEPTRQADVAYQSTEQLMESHRVKPLVVGKANSDLVKTAFDYTIDSDEDIESRWGWMNNVDDPMSVRVQGPNRFKEGLNWDWSEGDQDNDSSDKGDASDYRNVANQSRYRPEYVNGIYYRWVEPRDGADNDDPGRAPYTGYGTSTNGDLALNSSSASQDYAVLAKRFAQAVFEPMEDLNDFIQAVKSQVVSGKIQGTRLMVSPDLSDAVAQAAGDDLKVFAPQPVSSQIEIRYSTPHLGYATEVFKDTNPQAAINLIKYRVGKDVTINWIRTVGCPIWLVDPKIEDQTIQDAEEFAAGTPTPANQQAFEEITRMGDIKKGLVESICQTVQESAKDLGLAVSVPELPENADWTSVKNMTIGCHSLDESLKLSGLLSERFPGGEGDIALPSNLITWCYRGICCRFEV